jgi:hypothetical protein
LHPNYLQSNDQRVRKTKVGAGFEVNPCSLLFDLVSAVKMANLITRMPRNLSLLTALLLAFT